MSPRKWSGQEGELDSYIPIQRGLESGPLCGLWFSLGLRPGYTGGLASLATTTPPVGSTRLPLSKEKEEGAGPGSFDFTLQRTLPGIDFPFPLARRPATFLLLLSRCCLETRLSVNVLIDVDWVLILLSC